jgi:hypothetical protein
MPSHIGTDVAANYLKAKPSTQFGTRQLTVLNIAQADVAASYAAADSLFSKTVRALQQTAEVWAVFTPIDDTNDSFNVIISTDSQWPGAVQDRAVLGGTGGNATTYDGLEAALLAGSGVACTVTLPAGFVAAFNG